MRPLCITSLYLIDTILGLAPLPHIDWCLYWRYLNKDQFRPECNGVYRLRFSKYKTHDHRPQEPAQLLSVPWTPAVPVPLFSTNSVLSTSNQHGFEECKPHHTSCKQSGQCASGQLCIDSNGYCCGTKRIISKCPDRSSLVTHCSFRRRHVSWCESDGECAPHLAFRQNILFSNDVTHMESSQQAPSLCCPTQCGYNVCIH